MRSNYSIKKSISFFTFYLLLIVGCGSEKSYIKDPLREDQWYINGSNLNGNWIHVNLNSVSYKGSGVLVSLVDNGLDLSHEDIIGNIGFGSYSYLPERFNFSEADHGTACAGIIVAEEGNGKGIVGIAPKAKMIGFNALRLPSIGNLADSLVRHKERVWVSNNSWGDFNSWGEPLALRSLIKSALEDGVKFGRNGKGIIYVFSAGNGESIQNNLPTDNVNYSGLVNNKYTVPVCAIDENGLKTSYSKIGATLLVCAPSRGDSGLGISTTDVSGGKGYNPNLFYDDYDDQSYTRNFSGTSASVPIVSGVVALILEANSMLGWRDVKAILAKSARIVDEEHSDWVKNGAGLQINHNYGFGLIDADKAIELAKGWINFPDELIFEKELIVNKEIPNDEIGIVSDITIDKDIEVEFVDIFFDAPDHKKLGDLEIVLISPAGTKSILAEQHTELFDGAFRYRNWRFGSMRHLEENAKGVWQLRVKDNSPGNIGTFKSWKLKIYGHKFNSSI